MSTQGPHTTSDKPAEALAVEAVRALLKDHDAVHDLLKEEETLLTREDVLDRLPWSWPTVKKMIKKRQIRMVKVRGKWVISRKKFREDVARNFEAPKGVRTYSP